MMIKPAVVNSIFVCDADPRPKHTRSTHFIQFAKTNDHQFPLSSTDRCIYTAPSSIRIGQSADAAFGELKRLASEKSDSFNSAQPKYQGVSVKS